MADNRNFESISYLSPKEIEAYLIRLSDDRELYSEILENIDSAVCICGANEKIVFANRLFYSLLNFEVKEDAMPFYRYVSVEGLKNGFALSLREKKVYDEEFKLDYVGTVRYVCVHGFPFREKYYAYIVRDITDRKKELYEFKRLESIAALGNISALLAHDINNPLSAISVQSDLIKRNLGKRDNTFTEEHIDIIKNEIDRIKDIVKNFLYSARPVEITPLLQNPQTLIDNLSEFIAPTLESNGIRFILDVKKPLPYLEFDFNLLYAVLLNLIKNAMEAMANSSKRELTFGAERYLNYLLLYVSDTGCGIDDGDMENIFKPYFSTKKTGTGLGLSNVYKIVKLHSGDVQVVRHTDEPGVTFRILLPLKKESHIVLTSLSN